MRKVQSFCRQLYRADAALRSALATEAVEKDIDLLDMAKFCLSDKSLRLQYLWFLTDVGRLSPTSLQPVIDEVYRLAERLGIKSFGSSFCIYWLLCPMSDEQVAHYWDALLFWVTDPKENITTRKRGEKVIKGLGNRFPALLKELNDRKALGNY